MKNLVLTPCLILLALFSGRTYAQGNFRIHIGPAIPVADFADDENEDDGAAALGLDVGLSYQYPFADDGLGLFIGLDVMYNALKKDIRDEIEDWFGDDVTFPKYINVPISTGLVYEKEVSDGFALFAKTGVALSFTKQTKFDDGDAKETFSVGTGFGLVFGGGVLLNDNLEFGIAYMPLGQREYEADSDGFEYDVKLSVSTINLTVGFKLN